MVKDSLRIAEIEPLTFEELDASCTRNWQKVESSTLNKHFTEIKDLLNMQYEIAWVYIPVIQQIANYASDLYDVTATIYIKNLAAFYSSIELTKKGLYGPARVLMRSIFEGVTIAKYCSFSMDRDLIQKWNDGVHVSLTNDVLNKIKSPNNQELKSFWKLLNLYVHSTIYSQQVSFDINDEPEQIDHNLVFMRILLNCNYHILNRHLINASAIYYVKKYGNNKYNTTMKLKEELKRQLYLSKQKISKEPKKIISDFSRVWTV